MAKSEESTRLEGPMIRLLALPQRLPQVHLVVRVWIWALRHWDAGKPKLRARSGVRMAHARNGMAVEPGASPNDGDMVRPARWRMEVDRHPIAVQRTDVYR